MARQKVKVLLSYRARRDLTEIYRYLSEQSWQALEKVDNEIFKAIRRLESFPHSGHWVKEFSGKRYREVLVYHYRLIYHLLEKEKKIQIMMIRHGKRFLPSIV